MVDKCISKGGDQSDILISHFFYTLWEICNGRNKWVFEGKSINPQNIILDAVAKANEFMTSPKLFEKNQATMSTANDPKEICKPPDRDYLKFNVDAATDLQNLKASIAVVVRDSDGSLLTGIAKKFPCCSVVEAETIAVREALLVAESLGVRRATIEIDNKEVVESCSCTKSSWRIDS